MKKIYVLLFVFCNSFLANAQMPLQEFFVETYPFKPNGKVIAIDQSADFRLSGASIERLKYEAQFPMQLAGNIHVFELAYLMGNPYRWAYDIKGNATVFDILRTKNRKTIVVGAFVDSLILDSIRIQGDLHTASFVLSISELGELEWYTLMDSSMETILMSSVCENDNNEIIVAGIENSISSSIYKLNPSNGAILQHKYFDGLRSISSIQYKNNKYFISGTASDFSTIDTIEFINPLSSGYITYIARLDDNFKAEWLVPKPYITFDLNSSIKIDSTTLIWARYEQGNSLVAMDHSFGIYDFDGNLLAEKNHQVQFISFDFDNKLIVPSKNFGPDSYYYIRKHQNNYLAYFLRKTGELDSVKIISNSDVDLFDISGHGDITLVGSINGDSLRTPLTAVGNPYLDSNLTQNFFIHYNQSILIGIDKESNNIHPSFYPNPVTDKIQITQEYLNVSIYDINGRRIFTDDSNKKVLDLSNLEPGLYTLELKDNRSTYRNKLLKK